MNHLKIILGCFLTCLLLNSCSVSKRHYRPGYHLVWNKSKTNTITLPQTSSKNSLTKINPTPLAEQTINSTKTELKKNKSTTNYIINTYKTTAQKITPSVKVKNNFKVNDGDCDVLVLKSGEELSVKIKEIGEQEIRYVKCDNLTGPVYVVKKSSAFMVKFANGAKEIFTNNEPEKPNSSVKNSRNNPNAPQPKTDPLGIISFFGVLISMFVPFPTGVLLLLGFYAMAIASLLRIKNNPDQYKGKAWAIMALLLPLITLVLVIIIILALV
jgi:hypothetical protein